MSDVHGAVGSYVVHGLSEAERADFERHLSRCASCRVEVRELVETVAELSRLTSRTPPAGLRRHVLADARGHRPLPPQQPAATSATLPARSATAPTTAGRARPRRRRRPWWPVLALAFALALVLGGGVVGLAHQHQVQTAQAREVDRLMTADDVQVHRALVAGGRPVTLVVSRHQDRALLVGGALPVLDAAHSYQVWTQDRAGAMAPGPVFPSTEREHVWLTAGVGGAVAVALTVEPRGGSTRPTTGPEVIASF